MPVNQELLDEVARIDKLRGRADARWHDDLMAFEEKWTSVGIAAACGDPDAVEAAIGYLETRPRGYRTGYVAEFLMKRVSRAPLTRQQQERARALVRAEVGHGLTRGTGYAGALAAAVWDAELAEHLARIDTGEGREAKRARGIAAIAQNRRSVASARER